MKQFAAFLLSICFCLSAKADLELYKIRESFPMILDASQVYKNEKKFGLINERGDSVSYEICWLMMEANLCAMCIENNSPFPAELDPAKRIEELSSLVGKKGNEFLIRVIFYQDYEGQFHYGIDMIERLENGMTPVLQKLFSSEEDPRKTSRGNLVCMTSIEWKNSLLQEYLSKIPKASNDPVTMAIQIPYYNYLYRGVETEVRIAFNDVPPEEIAINVSNATWKGEKGRYFVTANKGPEAEIELFRVQEEDSISLGSYYMRVKSVPDPSISVQGKDGGTILQDEIATARGLRAAMVNFDIPVTWKVSSCKCVIQTDGNILTHSVAGPAFNEELRAIFRKVKTGSTITFTEIMVSGLSEERKLEDVKFTVN